ncbi:MAG TPA: cytochrome c biogenesis protein CcsA [Ktedonobacteraceae bacterium]|jgi:heme exporter protein C|nr:cytochrome c biogenesis protein CcsA [Ktedonobacteraceae bacterium]
MALTDHARGAELQGVIHQSESVAPGKPLATWILGGLSFVGIMLSIWMIFLYAPTELIEGQPQRIFYVHVPMSWIGMLAFGVLTLAGVGFLITRDERWDWAARASAEIGTVFITLALITGSIWGRTTWGTWWTWDPKLTATLILWFMYVAYLMLRSYMGRTTSSAYSGVVLSIVGVIDVPIIYLSVQWWRGLHPTAVTSTLPTAMLLTLMVSLISFTLLYCFFMVQIYQLEKLQTLAQRLRASLE